MVQLFEFEQDFYNIEDLSKEQLDTLKERNIVGCDPGKRSLVYMMDKNGNKLQYTAPQRKRESKAKTNQRILLYLVAMIILSFHKWR